MILFLFHSNEMSFSKTLFGINCKIQFMAQTSADQTAGLKCEMCHELEQPLLFVATLTPIFNKTLGRSTQRTFFAKLIIRCRKR